MKGAVNVISIILISGIIITLVGASYMWSVPLLQKQQDSTIFQTGRSFVLSLNEKIIDIANSGSGEESIEIPMGIVRVVSHDAYDLENNSIFFEVPLAQSLAFSSSKTYLGGVSFLDTTNNTAGVFGESSPSIISMQITALGKGHLASFQILFRELVTKTKPVKKFKISLNKGSEKIMSGESAVTIGFGGTSTDADGTMYTNINVMVV